MRFKRRYEPSLQKPVTFVNRSLFCGMPESDASMSREIGPLTPETFE